MSPETRLAALAEEARREGWNSGSFGRLVDRSAQAFLGLPYKGGTLERSGAERLVVNLRELDCVTLIETSLGLARAIRLGAPTMEELARQLTQIRYRNGRLAGYRSRLHYMSDWLHDNGRKGVLRDLSREAGGAEERLEVSFMSSHPQYYPALKGSPKQLALIAEQERTISSR